MGRSVPPGDDLEAKEVELEVPRESLLDKGSTLHDESGRHGESYSPQGRDEDLAEDEDNGWDITPAKPSGLGGFGSASSFIPTADIYELGIVARPPEEDHVDPAYMGLPALRLPKSNAEEAHTTDKVMGYSQMIGERMVQEEMEKAGINGCPEDGTTNSAQQTRSEKTVQTHNDTRDLLGPARQKLVAFKFGAKSHVAIPQQPGKVEVSSVSRDRSVRVNEEKASMRLEDERGIQPDSRDSDSSESRKRRQYDDHEHGEVAECTDSRGKRARRAEVMTSAEVISGHDIARTCMPPPSKTKADQHRPTFLSPPPSETFTAPSAPRVIKPFTRTSYPDPLAPPSTILNLGSESLLRTCFRVGEVLRCSRSKDEERVMIIEFFGKSHIYGSQQEG
ncbi:hypothetical protein SAICODRAFT_131228 [Saitoella complicata NRRL Y-17804]|uniref:uncharacterized protein n=1 Tax=Saitoella complicata (strain BCRC 22490 / CBS 7301 / JCM 7358 / NBRC 10748 / NRRL Y-17804) TaxID=698492 RepID=UPI0008668DAE|nr:uncharacterized protein SAICODRAFT_131228 [Saitoella complicata NRRL Y-17804]ODQ52602.1 hypothetical protein SAICODRAFT_131228 [Saitoella complicata NRRL Y-17804]